PALAAMQASLDHSTVPTFREGVGIGRAIGLGTARQDPLTQLLKQAVYDEQSPKAVTDQIENVAEQAFLRDLSKGQSKTALSQEADL
ncbi:MAG: hypothetical protein ACH34U_14860, partial [Cyanobium sp.]